MEEEIDAYLVNRARADDTHAFRSLVERYEPMAFYLALRLVGQEESAHELVQEALLQAYLSLDHLRDDSRFKSWLYGIVLNLCRNWQRLHPARELSLDSQTSSFEHLLSDDPQVLVEERELKQSLRSAIDILTPKNQAVAYLFYYEDLSMQEIASCLAISLSAVKNRLHLGRQQLQAHLQALYPEIIHPGSYQRRGKAMLRLHLVKVVRRQNPLYSDTLVPILLNKRQKRVWAPMLSGKWQVRSQLPISSPQDVPIVEPDTTDLLAQMIHSLQGKIEEVAIDELYVNLLYARVRLSGQHGQHILKARLNDALRLAIYERSPITIARTVFDRQGIPLADYGDTQEQQFVTLEQIAKHSPSLLQSLQSPDNLDFSQGLCDWTFYNTRGALDRHNTRSGKPTLMLTLQPDALPGVGLLSYQGFRARAYSGKRIRATAYLKAEGMQQPAFSLTLRRGITSSDDASIASNQQASYYNTTENMTIADMATWTPHVLVMDVPQNTHSIIKFDLSMRGQEKGIIWLDRIQLEMVDNSVPLTETFIDPHAL